ncbi:hypothetical protein VTK26DRAFT_1340 [Humicola hyalothermophila]
MSSEDGPPNVADISSPSDSSPSPMNTQPAFAFTKLLERQHLLVLLSSMAIIWLGAHASLRRPPSAAPPKRKKGEKRKTEPKFAEGLVASDAIMFPLLLGTVLVGLYYLIQWLQDPTLLNKLLRGYISIMSIAGLATLAGDALDVAISFLFPDMWVYGLGRIQRFDPDLRCQYYIDRWSGEKVVVKNMASPLPGTVLPKLVNLIFSPRSNDVLWNLRHLLNEEWTLRVAFRGATLLELPLRMVDCARFPVAVAIAAAYHFTGWDVLSNLLSFAMCYASFSMFSPTSFGIGTLVLAGLFVYDIVMVFYTPFMVTVATKIDAPMKLVYTNPKGGASMLGLGDIVVPGMLMALALRFDLYQFYAKQTTLEPVRLATETATPTDSDAGAASSSPTAKTTTTTTHRRRVKPTYVPPRNQWGNRFWCTFPLRLSPVSHATEPVAATAFPKPYFYASLAGYAAGMLVTLVVLLVFGRGQPALLYLVPGVTGALWLTGWARGEVGDMWGYTEDGSLDVEDVVVDVEVEVDGEGRVVKEVRVVNSGAGGGGSGGGSRAAVMGEGKGGDEKKGGEKEREEEKEEEEEEGVEDEQTRHRELFVFSITAPRAVAST